ncbi:hypothetical protein CCACVL1_24846 [Corchorus capsularis]|uniref:Uncharacterized protein n=1 Tax=Corchorus capsularis TaxID=210143 RepID=A0A1R3GMT9_COCAP|nr:hypothetical protein CCACVL1_24846 [Corchorus capsularis]
MPSRCLLQAVSAVLRKKTVYEVDVQIVLEEPKVWSDTNAADAFNQENNDYANIESSGKLTDNQENNDEFHFSIAESGGQEITRVQQTEYANTAPHKLQVDLQQVINSNWRFIACDESLKGGEKVCKDVVAELTKAMERRGLLLEILSLLSHKAVRSYSQQA